MNTFSNHMGPQILFITLHFCDLTGGPCEKYKLNGLLAKSGKEALDILGPEFGVLRISENFEALRHREPAQAEYMYGTSTSTSTGRY